MKGYVRWCLVPAVVLLGVCLMSPSAATAHPWRYGGDAQYYSYYGAPVHGYYAPGYYDPGFYSYRWPGFVTFRAGAVVVPRTYYYTPVPYPTPYPGPYLYRGYRRVW